LLVYGYWEKIPITDYELLLKKYELIITNYEKWLSVTGYQLSGIQKLSVIGYRLLAKAASTSYELHNRKGMKRYNRYRLNSGWKILPD